MIQDLSEISKPLQGFLRRHRLRAKTLLTDGSRTETYVVDYVDRAEDRRDAVVVAAYALPEGATSPNEASVLMRRQVRYPPFLLGGAPTMLELVAGLIELPERPEQACVRELLEEASLEVSIEMVESLGAAFFASPGILTERMFPVAVRLPIETLHAAAQLPALGDGSPMEEGASLVVMGISEAIEGAEQESPEGICDAKTELTLRRLRGRLNAVLC